MTDAQPSSWNSAATLRAFMRVFINLNLVFILIPETLIWIIFTGLHVALSPLHKIFLLLLVMAYLLLFSPRSQLKLLLVAFLFSISGFVTLSTGRIGPLLASVEDIARLLLLFATYYYFKTFADRGVNGIKPIDQFIWVSFTIVGINLVLGAMGYGNAQRSLGIGSRGFFNAGNDVSTIATVLAAFVFSIKYKEGWMRMTPYLIAFAFFGYVLNTKAFIAGIVIILASLPLYEYFHTRFTVRTIMRVAAFLVLFPLLLWVAFVVLDSYGVWDRYLTFMDQYQEDSWLTFMLSRRDEHLLQGLTFVKEHFDIFHYFFGYGSGLFLESVPFRAEIDPFEIFFYFGIIGVIVTYGWFLFVLVWSFRIGKNTSSPLFVYQRGLFAANVYLFFQSIVAGHVFMSVLVCIYLGAINGIIHLRDE